MSTIMINNCDYNFEHNNHLIRSLVSQRDLKLLGREKIWQCLDLQTSISKKNRQFSLILYNLHSCVPSQTQSISQNKQFMLCRRSQKDPYFSQSKVCNTSSVCLSRNKQQIQGQNSENFRITETLTVLFTCITVYRSLKPLKNLRRSHQMILEMCCRVDTMSFNWTQTTTIELFILQSSKNLEENYYFMF